MTLNLVAFSLLLSLLPEIILANSFTSNDSLLLELDSITENASQISFAYDDPANVLFEEWLKSASIKELEELFVSHPNQVIRAYAYVGLLIAEESPPDKAFLDQNIVLNYREGDVVYTVETSTELLQTLKQKKYRLQGALVDTNGKYRIKKLRKVQKAKIKRLEKMRSE